MPKLWLNQPRRGDAFELVIVFHQAAWGQGLIREAAS